MRAQMTDAALAMDRMYRRQRHIYDFTRKFYLLGRDALIGELDARAGGAALEIGCGTGRNLILAARRYPEARFYGVDISNEMLATARAEILRARLESRISVAQADATAFDPKALFGVEKFERVYISYALSMIPPWREALACAAGVVAEGGRLMVIDFGDCRGLPSVFREALNVWLSWFGVHPREKLEEDLFACARERGFKLAFRPLYRGYAFLGVLTSAGN
jgi:S-adenosylmethionine-diacylgycerolhomoserine-N-methlytransferase